MPGMETMDANQYREALNRKLEAVRAARASSDPYGQRTGPKAADNYMDSLEKASNRKFGGADN